MGPDRPVRVGQVAALAAVLPILLFAFSSGPDAGVSGVPGEAGCTACHNGPPGAGSVTVSFPGGTTYTPGVKQHLTVTITERRSGAGDSN